MKIKLTISYDGTEYKGWQSQTDYGNTVQQTLIEAIFAITGERVTLIGSGRTDAGVHAEGQVASFSTSASIPPENFARALNTALPPSVRVLKSELVEDSFNARSSAKRKTYRYNIYEGSIDKPLKDRYAVKIYGGLDIEKMKEGARLIVGEHDFKAFSATGSVVKTTVREIYFLDIVKKGEDISFTVCGNGFLYNMVRIMVGVLIKLGLGKIGIDDVKNMIDNQIRPNGIVTLPPNGLTLLSVEYN